ncbi:MAG: type II toxin-antitoxin system VapC family toxin [Anaerolineae bacterium]|nr:type II toxin-antitoxin system VapC family toxin [Anaerolineae bacterium]
MLICIDSNLFILGTIGIDADAAAVMDMLPELDVVVPRMVIVETVRNLAPIGMDKQFFATIGRSSRFRIVDAPIPAELVEKYIALGPPAKADALIGAFTEWVGAQYLISDNRHFLRLTTDAFEVLQPGDFLRRWQAEML